MIGKLQVKYCTHYHRVKRKIYHCIRRGKHRTQIGIAKERGIGECDPRKIDLYWIREGQIARANLADVKRYRIGVNLHTWSETGEQMFW